MALGLTSLSDVATALFEAPEVTEAGMFRGCEVAADEDSATGTSTSPS